MGATGDGGRFDALANLLRTSHGGQLHRRRPGDGVESLAPDVHDAVVVAVRAAVPDLEISCSTQEDIDLGEAPERVATIRAWRSPPDAFSLNLAEPGVIELGAALIDRGIGIEAGVFTPAGADALLAAPWASAVHRVLVEVIYEHDDRAAVELARAVDARVVTSDDWAVARRRPRELGGRRRRYRSLPATTCASD
jgi:uncharacterized protein (DUF849 family)